MQIGVNICFSLPLFHSASLSLHDHKSIYPFLLLYKLVLGRFLMKSINFYKFNELTYSWHLLFGTYLIFLNLFIMHDWWLSISISESISHLVLDIKNDFFISLTITYSNHVNVHIYGHIYYQSSICILFLAVVIHPFPDKYLILIFFCFL